MIIIKLTLLTMLETSLQPTNACEAFDGCFEEETKISLHSLFEPFGTGPYDFPNCCFSLFFRLGQMARRAKKLLYFSDRFASHARHSGEV